MQLVWPDTVSGALAWNAFAFDHHVAAGIDGVCVLDGAFAEPDHFADGNNRFDIVMESGATSSLRWPRAINIAWLGLVDVAGLELKATYVRGAGRHACTATWTRWSPGRRSAWGSRRKRSDVVDQSVLVASGEVQPMLWRSWSILVRVSSFSNRERWS